MKKRYRSKVIIGFSITLGVLMFLGGKILAFDCTQLYPKAISLGGSLTAYNGNCMGEALAQNPAALVKTQTGILFNYNNPFGFDGFTTNTICLSGRVKGTGFATTFYKEEATLPEENHGQIVNNSFAEKCFGIGFGTPITSNLNLGLALWQTNRSLFTLEDTEGLNGSHKDIYIDLGLIYDSDWWSWGAVIKSLSIVGSSFKKRSEYKLGFRFGKVDKLSLVLDLTMSENSLGEYFTSVQGGIEGWLQPNIVFRTGINEEGLLTYGCGLEKKHWLFNYAFQTHLLGSTHFLETGYKF